MMRKPTSEELAEMIFKAWKDDLKYIKELEEQNKELKKANRYLLNETLKGGED